MLVLDWPQAKSLGRATYRRSYRECVLMTGLDRRESVRMRLGAGGENRPVRTGDLGGVTLCLLWRDTAAESLISKPLGVVVAPVVLVL